MHGGVILRRAGAVDAPEQPHDVRRRFVFLHARGQRALPAGAGDGVFLGTGAGGALARHLEDVGPAIEHREEIIAVLHVRQAQHPRLLADINPGGRVKRVGIRRGHVAKLRRGILAHPHEVTHRRTRAFGFFDVGHHAARHLHRHERIAIDIGFDAERHGFEDVLRGLNGVDDGRGDGASHRANEECPSLPGCFVCLVVGWVCCFDHKNAVNVWGRNWCLVGFIVVHGACLLAQSLSKKSAGGSTLQVWRA